MQDEVGGNPIAVDRLQSRQQGKRSIQTLLNEETLPPTNFPQQQTQNFKTFEEDPFPPPPIQNIVAVKTKIIKNKLYFISFHEQGDHY